MEVSKNWRNRSIHIKEQANGGSAEIDSIMVDIVAQHWGKETTPLL